MKKIIFTGGGTGGHIMPNIALIDELKNKYEIEYIGSKNGMEKDIVTGQKTKIPFFEITTCKLKRSFSFDNLLIPFRLVKGYFEAKKILKTQKPDLVFSKGGYVSVPVVFASKRLKIPVVSHESDYSIGLANKLTCKISKAVCTSFEATSKTLKNGVWTGSPINKKILNGNKNNIKDKLQIDEKLPTILVVGGSLGSKNINVIIEKSAKDICKKFNLVHIVGKNNLTKKDNLPKNYNQIEFAKNIEDYYNLCDIAITRGGSNVLFELLAVKKPMIIIPLEKGSRGDQVLNANEFEKNGFAEKLTESQIKENIEILQKIIEKTYKNREKMQKNIEKYKNFGNLKIIEQIEKYIK